MRLERTFQAFFRRLADGEQPGYPRLQGQNRYHSFTYPQYGNRVVLDRGVLSLAKIERLRIRLHRSLESTPKTVTISREADGWYACFSCAEVPMQPLPPTGQETGIDVGLKVFLITADGEIIETPPLSQGREATEESPPPGIPPQERQQSAPQGCCPVET